MLIDTTKPVAWRCLYHACTLEPGGHSAGMGSECWPGTSYDYERKEWFLDSSELACPKLPLADDLPEEGAWDLEARKCGDSWALVNLEQPELPTLPSDETMKVYGLPPAATVLEYLLESQHTSWDGFSARNRTAIRAMVKDMWLYHTSKEQSK